MAEYKGKRDEGYLMYEFASHDVDEAGGLVTASRGWDAKAAALG